MAGAQGATLGGAMLGLRAELMHIPQMIDAEAVAGALAHLQERIAELEAENERLRAR